MADDSLRSSLKNTENEIKALSEEATETRSALSDMKKELSQSSRATRDFASSLGAFKSPLLSSIANMVASNKIAKEQIALKNSEIEQLKKSQKINAVKLELANKERALTQTRIQTLKSTLDRAKLQESLAMKEYDAQMQATNALDDLVKQRKGYVDQLKSEGVSKDVIAQAQSQLTEANERLKESYKVLSEKSDQQGSAKEKLEQIENQYGSNISKLNNKLKQQDTTVDKLEKNQSALADQMEKKEKELRLLSIKKLSTLFENIGKSLSILNDTIRKTQQAFGVAAGQAGKMQLGAVAESFKSMFTAGPMVGREEVMGARSAFQSEFGGVISSDAAGKIAQQAKELGVTTESLAEARRIFMTSSMGNLDEAKSQQDQLMATFREQGLTNKDALESIRQNSELFARNGNRFAQSFAKAAAEAKKIGVDLGKVDQIGDNIIGDFEGFLEKTAELGAMGFNLDTQRLGEISESGDTGALFNELRSQLAATGKDITNLRRSEQLSLSGAFGIPMAELQRLAGPTADSGEKKDPIEESNTLLSKMFNSLEKLGTIFNAVSTVLTGVIAISTASTAINTARIAAGGSFGGARGFLKNMAGLGGKGAGAATTVATGASGASAAASATSTAAGAARGASMLGRVGRFAKFGARALGKVALPLQAAMGAYDAFQGFNADSNASFGQRLGNAGSSALSGMTFGLLGRDASEIREAATSSPTAPRPARPVTSRAPQEQQQVQGVNMAELSAKLDQVVRAIASMEVKLDGQKVGQIIVANEQKVTQSAPFRGQR
jgi:hypothetical protein